MHFFLTCLLAALLTLNAAQAAVTGLCDVLEHTQSDSTHFGHHSHEHSCDAPGNNDDGQPAAADHHHAHVHPGFSTLLSSGIELTASDGRSPYGRAAASRFASAAALRRDRPPQNASA